jgi:hypothetical protein
MTVPARVLPIYRLVHDSHTFVMACSLLDCLPVHVCMQCSGEAALMQQMRVATIIGQPRARLITWLTRRHARTLQQTS